MSPALRDRIAEAALADESFLDQLLHDPKAEFRRRFGEKLLPGGEVTVLSREAAAVLYLPRLRSA